MCSHGEEDYELFLSHASTAQTPIVSCVDDDGLFTAEAGVSTLTGQFVLDAGNRSVVQLLTEKGALLKLLPYKHRYPYDWRTKKPVIMRATKQYALTTTLCSMMRRKMTFFC
jgi:isoleucyl-tRNA synthetase